MDPLTIKRRLTCILATDAVGYSRHMARDEDGTIRILSAHRAVIDGIITFHEGRIISTAGDSVLAEFSSAVQAVRCAIEIQEALKTRNDSLPEDRRMLFRVGVNLGDVVVKNGDLLGDGVNVAARLESIAEPGGICISSSVYDQITGKLDLGFTDIGEQALKNISRPIRVYRVSGTAPVARPVPAPPPAQKSNLPWMALAGVGVALVAAGAAWQMGWLRTGPSDSAAPKMAAAPAVPSVATPVPPGSTSAAAPDPDARRAQADADSARTRADADALKRQAEAELARARSEAEAARASRRKADSESDAARVRAQAEADAARIRADAEKQAAKIAQSAKQANAPPPVVAAAAPTTAMPAPDKSPQTAAAVTGATAFDGAWNVTVICPVHTDGAAGFRLDFPAQVKDGYLRGGLLAEGAPGSLRLEGQIRPDGSAILAARGRTGDPKFSMNRVSAGLPYGYSVAARFEGSNGTGKRVELRACNLNFAKL